MRRLVLVAALGVLISVIRRMAPVRRYEISESSMSPELLPGDYVVSVRWLPIGLGSIVVFEHPDRPGFFLTKRVVGLPGERVRLAEGQVSIDGISLGEPWADGSGGPDGEWLVEPDRVFVLGDQRERSRGDSRQLGTIPLAATRRVWIRYWPLHRLGAPGQRVRDT